MGQNKPAPCPQCGSLMDRRSKLCKTCRASLTTASWKTEPCPQCGQPKDKRAKLCRACRHYPKGKPYTIKGHPRQGKPGFDPQTIDFGWACQFAGLFWGEGCFQIGFRGRGLPRPMATIHLREDDAEMLHDIQRHLGGRVYAIHPKRDKRGFQANPQVTWQLDGYSEMLPLCDLMLAVCLLPSKKVQEVHLVRDYILWRQSIGTFPSEADKVTAHEFDLRMKELHRFVKVQGQVVSVPT